MTDDEAYAVCLRLARSHYENFPVASWLLPARMRPHVAAIYAFARTADDLADEGDLPDAERLEKLDAWEARLDDSGGHPVFVALARTREACALDTRLFRDLISAFRQDVTTKRYETWSALLDYCRRSANPVGRLVLGVAGVRDESTAQKADAVCTALQLTNFWQDVDRDRAKGRDYLPADLVAEFGERARQEAGRRTRELFAAGRSVADDVRGRLRWELRATWLGGVRILDRIAASGFDPSRGRPALRAADLPALVWDMVTWR